jgi:hypothetical protein
MINNFWLLDGSGGWKGNIGMTLFIFKKILLSLHRLSLFKWFTLWIVITDELVNKCGKFIDFNCQFMVS